MSKYDVALEVYQEFDNADEDGELVFSDWLHAQIDAMNKVNENCIWVPERVDLRVPLYADGRSRNEEPRADMNSTLNIHKAVQFKTEASCIKWCEKWAIAKFTPVEHRIG